VSRLQLAVPDTGTVLIQDYKQGDTVLYIRNGSKWEISKNGCVVYGIKKDLSDLPNPNTQRVGIAKKERLGYGQWKITLGKGLTKSLKTGTKVREHIPFATYTYIAKNNPSLSRSKEWQPLTGACSGFGLEPKNFWPGTKYIQFIAVNSSKGLVEIKGIKLEIAQVHQI